MIGAAQCIMLKNKKLWFVSHAFVGVLASLLLSCSHLDEGDQRFKCWLNPDRSKVDGRVLVVSVGNWDPWLSSNPESESIYSSILQETTWIYNYNIVIAEEAKWNYQFSWPDDIDPAAPEFQPRLSKENDTFILSFHLYNPRSGIEEWIANGTWIDGKSENDVGYRHYSVKDVFAYKDGKKKIIVRNGKIKKRGEYQMYLGKGKGVFEEPIPE